MARQGSPLIGLLFIALIVAAGLVASETLGGGGAARVKPKMFAVTNVGPEGLEAVIYQIEYRGEIAKINDNSTWKHEGWEIDPGSQTHYVKLNIEYYTKGKEDKDDPAYWWLGIYYPLDPKIIVSKPELNRDLPSVFSEANIAHKDSRYPYPNEGYTFELVDELPNKTRIVRKYSIVPFDFYVNIKASETGDLDGVKNIIAWLALQGITWQRVLKDPSVPEGYKLEEKRAVIIPLMAYTLQVWKWYWVDNKGNVRADPPSDGARDNAECYPQTAGEILTLYPKPDHNYEYWWESRLYQILNGKKPIELLSESDEELLEWASKWSPDWRINRDVWFIKIAIHYLEAEPIPGIFREVTGAWFPSIVMRIRVLCLVYGEFKFLWTKQTAQELEYKFEPEQTTRVDYFTISDALSGAFGFLWNPLVWLGIGMMLMAILMLILLIMFPGLAIAIGMAASRGGRR